MLFFKLCAALLAFFWAITAVLVWGMFLQERKTKKKKAKEIEPETSEDKEGE